jgi:4-diphosphocytidyl-2-C-methyl-D-erythritol kinase
METEAGAEAAPAKVNLYLHVTGRRADGYHLLDSLAVFAGTGDVLIARRADLLSLDIEGPFAAGLIGHPDNLVLRAARLLAREAGVSDGAAIVLDKRLPVASGIGGGSSDAAAALRLLNRLWRARVPERRLEELAAELGADVPVCLRATAARMGVVGEKLDPAPALPECGLVLVNPGQAVATAEVFRARAGGFSAPATLPAGWDSAGAMVADLARLTNDLQAPAVALCPAISEVLEALPRQPDCLLARMSGSGATCFGLFPTPALAKRAAAALSRPGWWSWGGELRRN